MGIIPLLIGAKLTPFSFGKLTLIHYAKSRIKVSEPFEDSSKKTSMINRISSLMVVFLSDHLSQS